MVRSPYAHLAPRDLCFDWPGGPTLPVYEDCSLITVPDMESDAPLDDAILLSDLSPPPPPTLITKLMSYSDEQLDIINDFLLTKSFLDSELGLVTVTGWGRHEKLPVTFYNNADLTEEFSSTWEVFQRIHTASPLPSLESILAGEHPMPPPATPLTDATSNLADRRPVRACHNRTAAYKCLPVTEDTPKRPPQTFSL